MCMRMTSMTGSSAWARTFPLQAQRPKVPPLPVSGEADPPARQKRNRLRIPRPEETASGAGAGLLHGSPVSKVPVPFHHRKPVLPEECSRQHRPHQKEAHLLRRQILHPSSGVPASSGRNSAQSLLLKPPTKKAVVLFPALVGGPLPVPQEQGKAWAVRTARGQGGRVPVRPGRKRVGVWSLLRLRQEAAEQWPHPAQQEPDTFPIQAAPAIPKTEAPVRHGRNWPEARFPEVPFKEAARPVSTPVWQEPAADRLHAQLPQ